MITVGERLRCNRQTVADAVSFRAQIWAAVNTAGDRARNRGYSQEDIELATFAVIAFVDESILNLAHPIFADWPRQPLQEERYGHHVAGEMFFQHLQKLLVRTDTAQLADLLEVYYLCLCWVLRAATVWADTGSCARSCNRPPKSYSASVKHRRSSRRIASLQSNRCEQVSGDPVARVLLFVAIGCAVLVIALFIVLHVMLGEGVDSLQKTAAWSEHQRTSARHGATSVAIEAVIAERRAMKLVPGPWEHAVGVAMHLKGRARGIHALLALIGVALSRPSHISRTAGRDRLRPGRHQAPGGDSEIDGLVREADRRLAHANAGATIANLPLIFVIGDHSTAKTSTVVNSGIEAELLAGQLYQDNMIAPTRVGQSLVRARDCAG